MCVQPGIQSSIFGIMGLFGIWKRLYYFIQCLISWNRKFLFRNCNMKRMKYAVLALGLLACGGSAQEAELPVAWFPGVYSDSSCIVPLATLGVVSQEVPEFAESKEGLFEVTGQYKGPVFEVYDFECTPYSGDLIILPFWSVSK